SLSPRFLDKVPTLKDYRPFAPNHFGIWSLSRMARGQKRDKTKKSAKNGANLGFEQTLWQAADKLRGNMDAADYKHVVLGLIFLKYISDPFEQRPAALASEPHADPEDRDEYAAENVFWVAKAARWPKLQAAAKQATIGKLLDEAMLAIEKE